MIDERRVELYESLLRIRVIEDVLARKYASEQLMRCPAHFSVGQEAVAVAVSGHLQRKDHVVSAHRSHAHYLAKGGDLRQLVAELYGKQSGCTHGRGGSMHLLAKEVGFVAASPIVGSTIPIAAGIAFANVLQRRQQLTVVYFGDGATETGAFHETLNFSAVHNLPVIFVCENNLYSMETDLSCRQPAGRSITELARAHHVQAHELDGQDVEAAFAGFGAVVENAREQRRPHLVEFRTYRFIQHCGPKYDGQDAYRHPGEYEREKARDPVETQRRRLEAAGLWDAEREERLKRKIHEEVQDAIEFANASQFPEPSELMLHVYSEV
jgi:TPP-dependent pyruvate/acetoin dehydrogenase alpha subunit